MDENTPYSAPVTPPPPAPSWSAPRPPVLPPIVETKSPGLAGLLSFIVPGLGHLYLGAYQRALYIFGGMALSIVLITTGAWPFAFAIAFAWFYGIVDSVRLARAINLGAAADNEQAWEERMRKVTQGTAGLTWGVILIGLGALWLIDRNLEIDWTFMHDWGWATAFILLGVVLIASHLVKKRRENESGAGMPPRSR